MIHMRGFWRSAASFRVRIALNLKGLAYEEEMIDLDAGEQTSADHLSLNPHAAVPVVRFDDGPPMTQSLSILEYLEECYPSPSLLPADRLSKARVRAIALDFAADHHPLIVPRVRRYLTSEFGMDRDQLTMWIRQWFKVGLEQAEERLTRDTATGRFCHGNSITIADLCLLSHVIAARGFQIDTADLPTVDRISRACLEFDAVKLALPLRQKGAPATH